MNWLVFIHLFLSKIESLKRGKSKVQPKKHTKIQADHFTRAPE